MQHFTVLSMSIGDYVGFLLGDGGYPSLHHLLTPYPEPGPQHLQHSPQQNTSQDGDDHRIAEDQVPVPPQAQGPSGEGLRHHNGIRGVVQHCHYQRGTVPPTAPPPLETDNPSPPDDALDGAMVRARITSQHF